MVITTNSFCAHDWQFFMITWRDGIEMEEYHCTVCGAWMYVDAD